MARVGLLPTKDEYMISKNTDNMERLIITTPHTLSQSIANKNWFVKLDGKIIAGFKDKKDAELFLEAKIKCF